MADVLCVENILDWDLQRVFKELKKNGIDTSGLHNVQNGHNRLIEFYKNKDPDFLKRVRSEKDPIEKNSYELKEAIAKYRDNRNKLTEKYEEIYSHFRKLPRIYQNSLNEVFPDIEREFKERSEDLQKNECTILVAGDTGAGKSSLINFILGFDLLPTAPIPCTATTCEIRTDTSGKKTAVVHFHSEQSDGGIVHRRQPLILNLGDRDGKGISALKNILQEVDEYNESPYKHVQITWPCDVLEEGIVIVDTPGIGGAGQLSKYIAQYLKKSFGFIYVMTSTGAITKGRLPDFLRTVINSAGDEGFNPEASIFVANKWDQLEEKEQTVIQNDIWKKLSAIYPGLTDKQIYYMSVKKANGAAQYGAHTLLSRKLMEGIGCFLPDSLRYRLYSHYNWISAVVKRSIYSLKMSRLVAEQTKVRTKEDLDMIKKRMQTLETDAEQRIKKMRNGLEKEVENVHKVVLEALKSLEVQKRLMDWSPHDCPRGTNWKALAKEADEKLSERVALAIDNWQKHFGIINGIKKEIIDVFKKDFYLVENQIAELQGLLGDNDEETIGRLLPVKSVFVQAGKKKGDKKTKKKGKKDKDENPIDTLGSAVSCAGSFNISKDRDVRALFREYKNRSPVDLMKEATHLYVRNIFQSSDLKKKLMFFFKRFLKGLDKVAAVIPAFIKADRELISTLHRQLEDNSPTNDDILGLMKGFSKLEGSLDIIFINYIMKFDFKEGEVEFSSSLLGSGSYAYVRAGSIKINGSKMNVALKVGKDPLSVQNVSEILMEDRCHRDLNHKNIIRYYGSSWKKEGRNVHWVMVLELCSSSLKEKIIGPEVNNPSKTRPGSSERLESMRWMANYALQLCQGLHYIHSRGYVHRDLKTENVLLTEGDVLKLADVGMAKRARDIAKTKAGTPAYMAPEVLLETHKYDHKADIYSLAIILWEMWYGIDVVDEIGPKIFDTIEQSVKQGLRPNLNMKEKLPEEWARLITQSWDLTSKNRPEAMEHCRFFENFLTNNLRKA
ncbi:hypothetical protein CHS0354_029946 [Potamilus streckersoni]|uniref:Protein kinase domain-containing protein n=1 Tax=Potamilus streckersoni TaxID=2493646 RepID=A0AAE0RT14_9BIVA|nr:hypothetical protein CHS0354_029946 [Potamilus streckersoni]